MSCPDLLAGDGVQSFVDDGVVLVALLRGAALHDCSPSGHLGFGHPVEQSVEAWPCCRGPARFRQLPTRRSDIGQSAIRVLSDSRRARGGGAPATPDTAIGPSISSGRGGRGHGVGDPQCGSADPCDRRSATDVVFWGVDNEDLASAGIGVHGVGVNLEGLTQVTD